MEMVMKKKTTAGLTEIGIALEMDKESRVSAFEDFGMADPLTPKTSIPVATSTVNSYDFYTEVYP
jgi:hypothetical protein